MVSSHLSQEEQEQMTFKCFIEAARLPVISSSVRSERPPAPDIFCEIHGRGAVAFELVEIVVPKFVQEMNSTMKLENSFKLACESHPQIANRFGDARIYVGFRDDSTTQQRLSVVPKVVHELNQHSENSSGNIGVPQKLRKVVTEISITRGSHEGPLFDVREMTDRPKEQFKQIEKHFRKRYSSNHPIELLAHYTNQPCLDSLNRNSEFHAFVLKHFSRCPFERVWVYDNWSNSIKYVHPRL